MYVVGVHMDGIGWGEAADDDGSGAALVTELADVYATFSEADFRLGLNATQTRLGEIARLVDASLTVHPAR